MSIASNRIIVTLPTQCYIYIASQKCTKLRNKVHSAVIICDYASIIHRYTGDHACASVLAMRNPCMHCSELCAV